MPDGKNSSIANLGKSTLFPLDIISRNGKIWKFYGVIGNFLVASTK
jgi:hypothetical protein